MKNITTEIPPTTIPATAPVPITPVAKETETSPQPNDEEAKRAKQERMRLHVINEIIKTEKGNDRGHSSLPKNK